MDKNILTFEMIQGLIDKVLPILLYGTSEYINQGEMYLCKETELSPEYIVVHPNDLEEVKRTITSRRLVHIKDEPIKSIIARMQRTISHNL